jgi:hypothetical protein
MGNPEGAIDSLSRLSFPLVGHLRIPGWQLHIPANTSYQARRGVIKHEIHALLIIAFRFAYFSEVFLLQ